MLGTRRALVRRCAAVATAIGLSSGGALAQPDSPSNWDTDQDGWFESDEPAEPEPDAPDAPDDAPAAEPRGDEADPRARPVPDPPPPAHEADDAAPPKRAGRQKARRNKPDRAAAEPRDPGPPTLLGPGKIAFGGYGGVGIKVTKVADHRGLLVGGEGAFLIGHCVALGGGGYGLATVVHGPPTEDGADTRLHFGYGGPIIAFNFMAEDPVYFSLSALIGAGGFALAEEDYPGDVDYEDREVEGNGFFVAEPEISVYANLTRFMRLGANASYRIVHGVTLRGYRDADFRGPAAGLNLQFGWF